MSGEGHRGSNGAGKHRSLQDEPPILKIMAHDIAGHRSAKQSRRPADVARDALDAEGVDYELDTVGSVGAVIGTYAGPGAVGLAFHPLG